MVKDSSYKTIPTPIISDFDENQVMKLTPVINVAVFSGKRISKRDVNPKAFKKIASGNLEENNAKNPRSVATPLPGQSPLKCLPQKSHPQKNSQMLLSLKIRIRKHLWTMMKTYMSIVLVKMEK